MKQEPLTDEQRVLNRAKFLMQTKGLKRGDAFTAAIETLKKPTGAPHAE